MSSPNSFPPGKILVPTDMSETSQPALQSARCFHERFGPAILVLHARHTGRTIQQHHIQCNAIGCWAAYDGAQMAGATQQQSKRFTYDD